MVKVEDYFEHLGCHYSDPDQYLACSMCNNYKHMSLYRFRNRKCRQCICLHRYRYAHTRNQFREHVYKYNIQEASSSSFNLSVMYFWFLDLVLFFLIRFRINKE